MKQQTVYTMDNVMGRAKAGAEAKVAAAQEAADSAPVSDAAIDALLGNHESKTAGDQSFDPVAVLETKTAELAGIQAATVWKQANTIGVAIADGIAARAGELAPNFQPKVASQEVQLNEDALLFGKFAEDSGYQSYGQVANDLAEYHATTAMKIATDMVETKIAGCYDLGHQDIVQVVAAFK